MQMISLYRDPTGERVFSKTMPTSDLLQSSSGTKQQRLSEVGAVVLKLVIVSANFAVHYTENSRVLFRMPIQ